MQRESSPFIKRQERSTATRLNAVESNINALDNLYLNLDKQNFAELEKRVALFALDQHVERIHKGLKDLSETKNSKREVKPFTKEDEQHLLNLTKRLAELSQNIKKALPPSPEPKKDVPTIVVAGAGPVGYFSAVSLLQQSPKHQHNIVLVSDKYSNFPTRGGALNPWVLGDYAVSLGLEGNKQGSERRAGIQRLLKYVTLREQGDYSIKHLDMLGRATYLALGGKMITGMIDWNKIEKENDSDFAKILVTPETQAEATNIPKVSCVLNAMGANAPYPKNVERQPLYSTKDEEVLRTHCAQLNVSLSPELFENLIQLRDHYYDLGNYSFVPYFFHGYYLRPMEEMPNEPEKGVIYLKKLDDNSIKYTLKNPDGNIITDSIQEKEFNFKNKAPPLLSFQFNSAILKIISERGQTSYGKKDKEGNYKVQLFPNLTKNESDFLDDLVEQRFHLSQAKELDENQKKHLAIILKTQLFLEFLSAKANLNSQEVNLNKISLRDQIKEGKQLCREFNIPPPSAPPQEIVTIPNTKAVTTWVGAAALPSVINGRFVPTGVNHAVAVIDYLIQNQFHTGKFDEQTKAGKIFKNWLRDVQQFIIFERTNSKDMSNEMMDYFSKQQYQENKELKMTLPQSAQVKKEPSFVSTESLFAKSNTQNQQKKSELNIPAENLTLNLKAKNKH